MPDCFVQIAFEYKLNLGSLVTLERFISVYVALMYNFVSLNADPYFLLRSLFKI